MEAKPTPSVNMRMLGIDNLGLKRDWLHACYPWVSHAEILCPAVFYLERIVMKPENIRIERFERDGPSGKPPRVI